MRPFLGFITIAALIGLSQINHAHATIVTLNLTSAVSSDYIMLGNIAKITPSPLTDKKSAKIAAIIVGNSPLSGLSRPLNRGDVRLKLRANGIDPATIDFEGPADISVTNVISAPPGVPVADPTGTNAGQMPSAAPPMPIQKAVKFGDPVDILVLDGPVTIHAKGYANQDGVIGDTVQVRRDGVDHLLVCTVIDAGQVQLEE